jgi:hypothetical protein
MPRNQVATYNNGLGACAKAQFFGTIRMRYPLVNHPVFA